MVSVRQLCGNVEARVSMPKFAYCVCVSMCVCVCAYGMVMQTDRLGLVSQGGTLQSRQYIVLKCNTTWRIKGNLYDFQTVYSTDL